MFGLSKNDKQIDDKPLSFKVIEGGKKPDPTHQWRRGLLKHSTQLWYIAQIPLVLSAGCIALPYDITVHGRIFRLSSFHEETNSGIFDDVGEYKGERLRS